MPHFPITAGQYESRKRKAWLVLTALLIMPIIFPLWLLIVAGELAEKVGMGIQDTRTAAIDWLLFHKENKGRWD